MFWTSILLETYVNLYTIWDLCEPPSYTRLMCAAILHKIYEPQSSMRHMNPCPTWDLYEALSYMRLIWTSVLHETYEPSSYKRLMCTFILLILRHAVAQWGDCSVIRGEQEKDSFFLWTTFTVWYFGEMVKLVAVKLSVLWVLLENESDLENPDRKSKGSIINWFMTWCFPPNLPTLTMIIFPNEQTLYFQCKLSEESRLD